MKSLTITLFLLLLLSACSNQRPQPISWSELNAVKTEPINKNFE